MAGLETVYATHNFEADNPDEITFHLGEPILVLEKDEGYQDGWWQGRNVRGEIGLFPKNYTSLRKPSNSSSLSTLESKIDSLESTVSQMHIQKKGGGLLLPTPSASNSSQQSAFNTPQPLYFPSSASSTSSRHTAAGGPNAPSASYQKKLSTKYVHHSVATSLQNPELSPNLPEDWSVDQVAIWLGLMGFSDMAPTFQDQEITGDILLELNVDTLKELGVSTFGKRFKISNAIKVLGEENSQRKDDRQAGSPADDRSNSLSSQHHGSPTLSSVAPLRLGQPFLDEEDAVSDYAGVLRSTQHMPPASTPRLQPSLSPTAPSIASTSSLVRSPSLQQQPVSTRDTGRQPSTTSSLAHTPILEDEPLTTRGVMSMDVPRHVSPRAQTPLNRALSTNQAYGHWSNNNVSRMQSNGGATVIQPPTQQPVSYRASTQPTTTIHPIDQKPRGFVRNSLLPTSIRASMDGIAQRLTQQKQQQAQQDLPDLEGWLHKQSDRYRTWNKRWFVLKGTNLFYFKSPKETRMKGIINLRGYRIEQDPSIHTGKYCFKAQHERERTFYFYTESERNLREWLKALTKATITRDYSAPVMSSSTVPTVSLATAQRMKPRPPSRVYTKDREPAVMDVNLPSTDASQEPQPIMRMSMSDDSRHMYAPATPTASLSTEMPASPPQPRPLATSPPLLPVHQPPFPSHTQQPQPSPHQSTVADTSIYSSLFYNDEEEDLIDPHQIAPRGADQTTPSRAIDKQPVHRMDNSPVIRHFPASPMAPDAADPARSVLDDPPAEDASPPTLLTVPSASTSSEHWSAQDFVDWMNQHMDSSRFHQVTELRTGEPLVDLLESISGKEIRRPASAQRQGSGTLTSMQMLDNIVAAFKFMGREGVVVDGRYTIKDVFNGNDEKILEMLRTIKDWAELLHPSTEKMASGGTFGEEEDMLKQL
ncbi:PH-domain-containing protein [Hesseltinella vesiculosa]|uniref:PH-domain-containing protein n=1 Tax=Hesseltinella vesiculosa TaxID=101127 RepID=A0A1X2G7I1_9FUNG|nr:PH-domain-containing protein [Hesseltinella vesiculosa]